MKPTLKNEFLENFPVFLTGSGDLTAELLSVARYQAFPRDQLIYSEGDPCSAIGLLLSGEIRVYKTGESGREITLYEIGRGETCILTASCILSRISYPANAVTLREGEMLVVPATEFRKLVAKYEGMRNFVFTLLSRRLTSVMTLVEEVAFRRMDERLYEYVKERSDNGELLTTHQKIANDLGTSREVVSRLLKDFEKSGKVILSRNRIRLSEN